MKPDSVWLLDKQMTRATKLGCSDNAISWFRPVGKVQDREMIKLDATLIYTGRAAALLFTDHGFDHQGLKAWSSIASACEYTETDTARLLRRRRRTVS